MNKSSSDRIFSLNQECELLKKNIRVEERRIFEVYLLYLRDVLQVIDEGNLLFHVESGTSEDYLI